MSKIYGLTGGIASGKSTVIKLFKDNGYKVYDADSVARQVVVPGSVGLKRIVDCFGVDMLQKDGTLNRKKLGTLVFGNPNQLQKLNNITRPLIKERILKTVAEVKQSSSKVISIFEIQLLFEGNYQKYFDAIISLYVEPEIQLQRLMKRNNLTKKIALERINAQMSMDEKKRRADFVINNSSDLITLKKEVTKLMMQL